MSLIELCNTIGFLAVWFSKLVAAVLICHFFTCYWAWVLFRSVNCWGRQPRSELGKQGQVSDFFILHHWIVLFFYGENKSKLWEWFLFNIWGHICVCWQPEGSKRVGEPGPKLKRRQWPRIEVRDSCLCPPAVAFVLRKSCKRRDIIRENASAINQYYLVSCQQLMRQQL